jgi:hypothetical protein
VQSLDVSRLVRTVFPTALGPRALGSSRRVALPSSHRGGQVRKGERSTLVVFWKQTERMVVDEASDTGSPTDCWVLNR